MPDVTIDVENFSFAKQGSGPITSAFNVSWDDPLSMAAMFQFSIPAIDPKAALLDTQKVLVRIYLDGSVRFLGIVENKRRVIPADGAAYFVIDGRSFLAELEDKSLLFTEIGLGAGVTNAPYTVLTTLSGAWGLDSTNGYSTTTNTYYGRFCGASRLAALYAVQKRTGEHFIYRPWLAGSGDRKVIWIRGATVDSGIRAIQGGGDAVQLESNANICLITHLEEIEDGAELKNRLIVYGAGDDLANSSVNMLATASYTGGPVYGQFSVYPGNNWIDYNYSLTTLNYRKREVMVQFEDIAPISNTDADMGEAADMLIEAGMRWLERYGIPHKFYSLDVLQLPWAVQPGQTIRVIYYEEDADGTVVHDINTDLIIINIATTIEDGGGIRHRLTVSTTDRMPTSSDEEVANRIEKSSIYQTQTQLGPSVNTLSYTDEFDDTKVATLDFWTGPEIAQIQQVLLRFQVLPLRSTVKSIAGASTTTPSGGGSSSGPSSASTAVAESTHTHGIASPGSEYFEVPVYHDGGSPGDTVTYDHSSKHLLYSGTDVGTEDADTFLKGIPYTTTSDSGSSHAHNIDHTHTTPNHQHTFTPVITSAYGIYEDTGSTISLRNTTYRWTASGSGTDEYYCELAAGGDPGLSLPSRVRYFNGTVWTYFTNGSAGSLAAGAWAYEDNDTLGYNTVYVRLASGGPDPDTLTTDYIKAGYELVDTVSLVAMKAETTIKVNATDRTSSLVAASVSGWYELDVTAWVSNSTTNRRPTAETHTITILAATGARARIAAQLQIRALIQAVAIS